MSVVVWPFVVFALSLALIVVLITVLRVHAFFALMLAAITAGLLALALPGEAGKLHATYAVQLATQEFGRTAGRIGLMIALAAVIGTGLMESGAADKIVRRFLALFGERRAGGAIVVSSFVLSIPIFFDTFFMLLLPLARALHLRTGRDYMKYVLAICCGGTITHSLLAPHPGPVAMAEVLRIDVGLTMLAGTLAGLLPLFIGWRVCRWVSARVDAPLRETAGAPVAEAKSVMHRPDAELPGFWLALLPILIPIGLISAASCGELFDGYERWRIYPLLDFAGDPNIALLLGALVAVLLVMQHKRCSFRAVGEMIAPAFATAGVIILITSAGGAFGFMLKNAGVGEAITAAVSGRDINYVLLAWGVAAVIRIAQGSATVAMITAAAIMQPIVTAAELPYHPIYIFLAIAFGSKMLSWMNDSGFWVVGKLSGFTEGETLKSWTVLVSTVSVIGLVECLVFSALIPFK